MKDGKKLVYSGDSLRRFLHRKGLTYKDAAKELGLDKNTIGKAVRGGNMNINVLLSIANHWNFPITDFFIFLNSATHIVRNKFKILSNNILPSILPCQKIHLT